MTAQINQFEKFISVEGRNAVICNLLPYPMDEIVVNKLKQLGMACVETRISFEQELNRTRKKQFKDAYNELVIELDRYEKDLRIQFGINSVRKL